MSGTGKTRDNISKSYLADAVRFSAVCNNTLFNGQSIIQADGLQELDSHEAKAMGIDYTEVQTIWKDRDMLKKYKDECILAIIGIENQSDIHYCMPVRCFVYDALNYEEQRMQIRKRHEKEKDLKGAEFLSGFARTDKLIPVFTIVVYYGSEPWDGPCSLHEMLALPPELQQYREKIADYHLNLLDIGRMENLEQYEGELKAFFGFIKYHRDKHALSEFVQENQNIFQSLPTETLQAISIMAETKEVEKYCRHQVSDTEKEGGMNMCKALEDMKDEAREEGRRQGIFAIIADNMEMGYSKESIIRKLQKYFSLDEGQASEYMNQYFTFASVGI